MLPVGPAKRVVIHLNEDTVARRDFLYIEVFDFLWQSGVAGASLIRPEAGFGSHHHIHDASIPGEREHMPVRIDFIEASEKVAALLPELADLVNDGLIEVHDTTIYKSTRFPNTEAIR